MTKNRRRGGFTLAEMLIVVGIIVVLTGVAFVGVQNYQRSSTRLEFDTIAKEIFVAAQNHLTEAESQGLLEGKNLGNEGTLTEDKINGNQEVYYLLNSDSYDDALGLLLPAYAVDATILAGSYIIRYQPSSGTVLDVFYSRPGNPTFLTKSGTTFSADEYGTLMTDGYRTGGERKRENYNGSVIGWYGGEDPIPTGDRLRAPTFEVHNEETLWVKVTDPNTDPPDGYAIKLIVIGKISGAETYFDLENDANNKNPNRIAGGDDTSNGEKTYEVTLDDITRKSMHFADLEADKEGTKGDGGFIPGEDLEIKAVAYSTSTLANIALSAAKTTNSLFADPYPYGEDKPIRGSEVDYKDAGNPAGVAGIANFRHLENLDAAISELGRNDDSFVIARAGQTGDLSLEDFFGSDKTKENNIYMFGDTASAVGCFLPVTPQYSGTGDTTYPLIYDGQGHKVSDVKVEYDGAAGLFGSLADESEVKDLELIDFEITSTSGSAGALVGTATGTTITNVLAYNTTTSTDPTISGKGSVGGLIGSMDGGTVEKCGAAVYVSSSDGDAGGLIGSMSGDEDTVVSQCYSGGYMKQIFSDTAETLSDAEKNILISGAGSAGGLIGSMDGGAVEKCATGVLVTSTGDAGGLIGTATSGEVKASYSAGHTKDARYYDGSTPMYNVTASVNAGGLIGSALPEEGSTTTITITNCYSTCSAIGATAGGFVGTGSGTITSCYCTGLVSGTTEGAFAGSLTGTATGCQYFEIINEIPVGSDASKGYEYLTPLPKTGDGEDAGTHSGITAFDETAATYEKFCGGKGVWDAAKPYDTGDKGLDKIYGNQFNLRTVSQIGQETKAKTEETSDFVSTHYGDWPSPEIFVINTVTSSS